MWFRPSRNSFNRPQPFRPRLEALEDRSLPSGGALDPTFGMGGIVTTNFAGGGQALAVATYPSVGSANDGKVVSVGYVNSGGGRGEDFAVVRYSLDGTLDRTFGGTGEVITNLGSTGDEAHAVAVQSDGKIVVAGQSGSAVALARYNADGSLDASFGGKGKGEVIINIGRHSIDHGYSLALQSDGKILIAGTTSPDSSTVDAALMRFTTAGILDPSFGTGGVVITHFSLPVDLNSLGGIHMALAPGAGKIVVAAQLDELHQGPVMVVRYNTNGSLDTSFGRTGEVAISSSTLHLSPAVAVQLDGRIVVAGSHASDFALTRINTDGTTDTTFGSGGVVVTPLPTYDVARSVAIQSDGKIVVAGNEGDAVGDTNHHFMLARYNSANGSLDTNFGVNGIAFARGLVVNDYSTAAVALEPDGRIVVAGTYNTAGTTDFAVARFLAAGPQIGSFTASPNPVTAGGNVTLTASSITDTNPNSTITQVAFCVDSNNDGILEPGTDTLLGYATQTSPGVWTFTFTVNLPSGTYTLFAQAEDSYGVFGDSVSLALTVQ